MLGNHFLFKTSDPQRALKSNSKKNHLNKRHVSEPQRNVGCHTYVVLRGAADAAWLALYALPLIRPHCLHHVVSELQTRRVTCRGARQSEEGAEGRMDGGREERGREGCTNQIKVISVDIELSWSWQHTHRLMHFIDFKLQHLLKCQFVSRISGTKYPLSVSVHKSFCNASHQGDSSSEVGI